jgi:hypothetical protein
VWVTPTYELLDTDAQGTWHGFVPRYSKVDNFEATEEGTHGIRVASQPGCSIVAVQLPAGKPVKVSRGWANVSVTVADHTEGDHTCFVDVTCV